MDEIGFNYTYRESGEGHYLEELANIPVGVCTDAVSITKRERIDKFSPCF